MSTHAATNSIGADNKAIKRKAGDMVDATMELGGEAKKYASHRISDVKDGAASMLASAKGKISDANDMVVDYVKENPFKSLAIAAGIGFLAGYILKQR